VATVHDILLDDGVRPRLTELVEVWAQAVAGLGGQVPVDQTSRRNIFLINLRISG
jgi:hypothetical protein